MQLGVLHDVSNTRKSTENRQPTHLVCICDAQIQVPIVRKATQTAIENTRKELHETLEAVRLAQLQLEQLQREQSKDGVSAC